MRALPPGQIETRRFPVVGERAPIAALASPGVWEMEVRGLVARPVTIGYEQYMAMEHRELVFDIHCVTSWTRFDSAWRGVPLEDVLGLAGPDPEAGFVSFSAHSARGHHTSLPIDVALGSTWLVHEFDGRPLPVEHGGPVRTVTPGRYFYKSLKWLATVDVLARDRLGWWEENSQYHNVGDPMSGDQRFTSGSLRPDQLQRFLGAASYDKYRGRALIGLDLTSWRPASLDLRRLYLKNCDLSAVDLGSADLRDANLSLSRLTGAGLADANLAGADLEGADLTDADLTGADLSHTALSATRFEGAVVVGADFSGSWGLVESQQRYLESRGVHI